ncbi:hypothetical protein TELCIR_15627 [Teladorsagia circumcincta]|uniref:Uncharacterized protein n=1 Tax=Teladorsagia circumcincta TaxID=45464 RepID=A0A2G9TXM8_TELCI|nr:hypothetical protein TELCIR_15627 [Teladorsagia circumcincta]
MQYMLNLWIKNEPHFRRTCSPSHERNRSDNFESMRPSSDPPGCCTESRKMAANNQPASPDSGSLRKRDNSEVPKWIPPQLQPSYEAVVDVSTEKPIGTVSYCIYNALCLKRHCFKMRASGFLFLFPSGQS